MGPYGPGPGGRAGSDRADGYQVGCLHIDYILILEIQESRISEVPVIDALSREFEAAIENGNCKKILLDLHQVELMSSGMLSVLVRLYRELAERNGRFVLCGARPPVLKVFEMTRLDQLFRLEPDVTHGVSRLNR